MRVDEGRSADTRSVAFYFDYSCPYAYLGSTQVGRVGEALGLAVELRPMLLGGVFTANGTPQNLGVTLSPPKLAHQARDLARYAARFGATLGEPLEHPQRTVDALRVTLAAGVHPEVVRGFFDAYWVRRERLADEAVQRRVVEAAELDADDVLARAASDDVKADLRARTDEAVARGIFGAPAWLVDGTYLYWGQDRLPFVLGEDPRGRAPAGSAAGRVVTAFWDYSSPFAYLGMEALDEVATRTGAVVDSRPMLLGGLFRAVGQVDVPLATFSPAKQRYLAQDLARWAVARGAPFRWPTRFPMRTVKALRLTLALPAEEQAAFRRRVFRAYWAEDRDIDDDAVLRELAGAHADAAFAGASTDAVKAAVRENGEEAARRGAFGAPTFLVGDALFWGQDRLDLVEDALVGAGA